MSRGQHSLSQRTTRRTYTLAILLALCALYLMAPPAWMLVSSVSPNRELRERPIHWIPQAPTAEHFVTLLQLPGANSAAISENAQVRAFPRSFLNSFIISIGTAIVCVSLGSISAYSLARLRSHRARGRILLALLATRMVPTASVIIPIYFVFQKFGLLNSLASLILIHSGLILPFVIWILESFYRDFPRELEEAATIDGCTRAGVFFRIVLPLSRNSLAAAAAFTFITIWADFLVGLSFTSSEAAWPLSVALAQAINPEIEPNWGLLNAAGLFAAIVPAVLAFIFRGQIMRGMLSGATKG